MFFQASASFGDDVVLTVISLAAIRKTDLGIQLLFAAIALFFGV
jgi:hypothetical protein